MRKKALVVITWRPEIQTAEREVLLLKLIEKRGGYWQPVTGSVEDGETFAEGALREAEEETGLAFERRPQFLGLEYSFQDQWGGSREQAFLLPLIGGKAAPTVKIDPTEHTEYRWVKSAEAAALVKWDTNRKAIERATQPYPPLFLSRAGIFLQDGEEITHERSVDLLHHSLVKSGEVFLVRIGAEELEVVTEGFARFVRSYSRETGELTLSDGTHEVLDPATLRIEGDHAFACTLGNGWEAIFLSPAYYEITKDIREGSGPGEYVLHFLGRDQRIRVAT